MTISTAPPETKEDLQTAILRQLREGKANAIKGKVLAARLGEKDTRHIRMEFIHLIGKGHRIVGNSQNGYYIATTKEECREGLDFIMSYLTAAGYHHKILLKACYNILYPGQLTMGLE